MKTFVLLCVIGLFANALVYGFMPNYSFPLLGLPKDAGVLHIGRAIMGAYFGVATSWCLMAFVAKVPEKAIIHIAVFMFFVALMRVVSLVLDGPSHPFFLVALGLEVSCFLVATWFLRPEANSQKS
ncbi:MAG: hypothetical protein C4K58_00220 [Flavobacteriaceae bacterium]|nr:MAG: hypothetical protein C4K58_00220 [Flavobacteriaceae bacterium]